MNIPAYLGELDKEPPITYGTLEYDEERNEWVIRDGDPAMLIMAKRLFPGARGRGNILRFHAGKRTDGDLNWLMMRFPLRIMPKDKEFWEQSKKAATEHVLSRLEFEVKPKAVEPSPVVFNGKLTEFQKIGVGFLVNHAPTLLADEMGLGKTVQALAWIATISRWPGIIVVPTSVQKQWELQIKRFLKPQALEGSLFPSMEVHIIKGLRPYPLPPAHIYIIHYGLLRGWRKVLIEQRFQFCVFDEIQELRHQGTEKYSAASDLAQSIENGRVIGLSGTPIHNYGGEIWNIMNIIEFNCLGDWESFTKEWCWGYGNKIVKDPKALGIHLRREGLMLRRTKEEVQSELPRKHRIVQAIDSDDMTKAMQEIMKLIDEYDSAEGFKKSRIKAEIGRQLRQETGKAKAPYVADFVKMLLDAGEAVILYGYHHAVYDIWREKLKGHSPVFITGQETPSEKEASKNAFINGNTNLIIISLRAAAGIDGLQERSNVVVFGELDWSPAIHSQCEDRAHRIGQKQSVMAYYLVSSTGSDEQMMEALGLKTAQFKGIMGEEPETEEDRMLDQIEIGKHLEKVIEKIKEKMGKVVVK